MNKKSSKFTSFQFMYFCFNWIVGFGFIAAMSKVVVTGAWSLLSFVIAAFLALAVMLVFSRASREHPTIKGGVYGYSKLVFGKWGRFFQGWNQLQQIFLLSATAPLFLVGMLNLINNHPDYQIWYNISALVFFIGVTIIGIFGLKFSKLVIFGFATLKWIVIFGAIILVAYLGFKDRAWASTIQGKPGADVSVFIIISNILLFVFAFNGFNSLAAAAPDAKVSNFRKMMMYVYFIILALYFITFMLFLGIEKAYDVKGFEGVWKIVFGVGGLGIFIFGSVANRVSGSISLIYLYSRIIVPLAEDKYLPDFLKKKNKFGEYANAMYVSMVIIIFSMVFLTLLPQYLGVKDAFSKVVQTGTIIYVNTYLGAFIIFLILAWKKAMKIPLWEQVFYVIGIIISFVVTIIYLLPFIAGEKFGLANYISLGSYLFTLGLGYAIWGLNYLFQKNNKSFIKKLKKWTKW